MLAGYHYTSLQNYRRIKTQGLIPYRLDTEVPYSDRHKSFAEFAPFYGVWIWATVPSEDSHTGNILFQSLAKDCFKIVKLGVQFPERDVFGFPNNLLLNWHLGEIDYRRGEEPWEYHRDELAVIVTNPIPPSRILLCGTYDVQRWPDWEV